MGVHVTWDDSKQTLLRFLFTGHWTFDELFRANEIAYTMIDGTAHHEAIGMLLDISDNPYMPPNVISFSQKAITLKHPRVSLIILVTNNTFVIVLQKMLLTLNRTVGTFYKQADTLEAARQLFFASATDLPEK